MTKPEQELSPQGKKPRSLEQKLWDVVETSDAAELAQLRKGAEKIIGRYGEVLRENRLQLANSQNYDEHTVGFSSGGLAELKFAVGVLGQDKAIQKIENAENQTDKQKRQERVLASAWNPNFGWNQQALRRFLSRPIWGDADSDTETNETINVEISDESPDISRDK